MPADNLPHNTRQPKSCINFENGTTYWYVTSLEKMMTIVSNQVICRKCEDRPFSASVHDFTECKCGAVAVDGGTAYLRRVGDSASFEDISVEMPADVINCLIDAAKWAKETGRNDRGVVYAVLRALRDAGAPLNKIEWAINPAFMG